MTVCLFVYVLNVCKLSLFGLHSTSKLCIVLMGGGKNNLQLGLAVAVVHGGGGGGVFFSSARQLRYGQNVNVYCCC